MSLVAKDVGKNQEVELLFFLLPSDQQTTWW